VLVWLVYNWLPPGNCDRPLIWELVPSINLYLYNPPSSPPPPPQIFINPLNWTEGPGWNTESQLYPSASRPLSLLLILNLFVLYMYCICVLSVFSYILATSYFMRTVLYYTVRGRINNLSIYLNMSKSKPTSKFRFRHWNRNQNSDFDIKILTKSTWKLVGISILSKVNNQNRNRNRNSDFDIEIKIKILGNRNITISTKLGFRQNLNFVESKKKLLSWKPYLYC
jgi:hypothetical protein